MLKYYFSVLVLLGLLSLGGVFAKANAGNNASLPQQAMVDTLQTDSFKLVYQDKVIQHLSQFERQKQGNRLRKKMNDLEHFEDRLSTFLKYGLDTTDIISEIDAAENGYEIAIEDMEQTDGQLLTSRDLSASKFLLTSLLYSLEDSKKNIDKRLNTIEVYLLEYDSLLSDSFVFNAQTDTANHMLLSGDYLMMNQKLLPNFTRLLSLQGQLQRLRVDGAVVSEKINLSLAKIDMLRKDLFRTISMREFPNILVNYEGTKSFTETTRMAFIKEGKLLLYYLKMFWASLLSMLLIGFILNNIIKRMVNSIKLSGSEYAFINNPVFVYPGLSLLFFMTMVAQFIYFHSPFVFQGCLWLIDWFIVVWFIYKKLKPFDKYATLNYFLFLYPLVFFENFILIPFSSEGLAILILSLVIIFSIIYYWVKEGRNLPFNFIRTLLFAMVLFVEMMAILAILYGRYNLAKLCFVSSYFGVQGALFLYYTKELWYCFLQIPNGKKDMFVRSRFLSNLKNASESSQGFTNGLIYIGIFILYIRNSYFFSVLMDHVLIELEKERFVGKYAFSWYAIFTFLGVIVFTILISRIVTLLFDNKWEAQQGISKKGGIKNWSLIIKLIVFIVGFFLAFASAGVPMDHITIVIGSLGLGIGFGLQGVISNLFSGLIIAFERPFEINDQVEWNNMLGRIDEIGLRSSKIVNIDGSEIVVPNSDLIGQKLLNWTHSNNLKRMEVFVGLSYKSDLTLVKQTIEEVIHANTFIRKFPEPQVLMHVFGQNGIDCRLLFWVDIDDQLIGKSELILAIHKVFAEKGIEIPYPQLDLHLDEPTDKKEE